jgi:hypothetical protein
MLRQSTNRLQNPYIDSQYRGPASFPQSNPGEDFQPDNIYVNMIFDNTTGAQPIPATIVNNFSVPVVNKPDDYYLAITRFDIPLSEIPLFICPIVPNQGDPDLTPFYIGIDYLGVKYPINVHFFSYQSVLNAPVQDKPYQVITPYYYMYSVQQFLDIINYALELAIVASGYPMTGLNMPYFYFDGSTELISLVYPAAFITGVNKPLIFLNTALQEWINGFTFQYRGPQPQFNDFYFELQNSLTNPSRYPGAENLFTPTTGFPVTYPLGSTGPLCPCGGTGTIVPYYYRITQEYKSINNQVAVKKIYITSTALPTIQEFTPPSASSSAAILPILADFVPNINNLSDTKSIAYYNPESQYRLVDLTSSTPIRVIDLQIQWVDQQNNVNPLYLPSRSQANVKFVFAKRTLYKSLK